jgi:hypothetical protein
MLKAYGRNARHVSHPDEPFDEIPPDEWRELQARVEAFTSDEVFEMRDPFLRAYADYRRVESDIRAMRLQGGEPDALIDEALKDLQLELDRQAHEVGGGYDRLRAQIRREARLLRRRSRS